MGREFFPVKRFLSRLAHVLKLHGVARAAIRQIALKFLPAKVIKITSQIIKTGKIFRCVLDEASSNLTNVRTFYRSSWIKSHSLIIYSIIRRREKSGGMNASFLVSSKVLTVTLGAGFDDVFVH